MRLILKLLERPRDFRQQLADFVILGAPPQDFRKQYPNLPVDDLVRQDARAKAALDEHDVTVQ